MSGAAPVAALLVDARPVDHPTARDRGIARYTAGLLGGLARIGAPVVGLYAGDVEAERVREVAPDIELRRWGPDVIRDHLGSSTWYLATQLMLHPLAEDPVPSVVTRSGLPVAAVMYDVIPFRHPDHYLTAPSARALATVRAAMSRTLDAMLAISRFSADTAAEELQFPAHRIGVIGAGVDDAFAPHSQRPLPRPERILPSDLGEYVVAVTGGDERKNTEGLLRAWALVDEPVRRTARLVIATAVGAPVLRGWRRVADEVGIGDEVVFTGYVTDEEMVAVLQHARLAVMPSFDEGFGLPVLEAAACGCPSICSETSSLPEVLDEPAAWFDPYDPASIARAIERGLTDEPHRRVLVAAGDRAVERFTWERAAADSMASLAAIGPRWPRRARPPARRLALAGPFEGSRSGIGRYDVAVAGALDRSPRAPTVDRFVDGSATAEPTGAGPHRLPVRALGRYAKPWNYDAVVAVLGSSPHHVATASLATHVPCHVWLHEPSLVGVHVGLAHASGSAPWGRAHVAGVIGPSDRARVAVLLDDDLVDAPRLDELGVTLLDSTLARARSVIVSSDLAADVVRRVRPDGPPLLVLPLAFPPVSPPADPPADRIVVAPGWLAANKAPLCAVELLGRLPADVRLCFAGPAEPDVADEVRRAADDAGVGERVEITGWLDDEAYGAHLAAARVGLLLRVGDRGAMSAALADLLARGIPAVTTLATADSAGPGVQLEPLDVDRLAAAVEPLLVDDARWAEASADAVRRARSWTFDDVAGELLAWLDDVDDLPPDMIRRPLDER